MNLSKIIIMLISGLMVASCTKNAEEQGTTVEMGYNTQQKATGKNSTSSIKSLQSDITEDSSDDTLANYSVSLPEPMVQEVRTVSDSDEFSFKISYLTRSEEGKLDVVDNKASIKFGKLPVGESGDMVLEISINGSLRWKFEKKSVVMKAGSNSITLSKTYDSEDKDNDDQNSDDQNSDDQNSDDQNSDDQNSDDQNSDDQNQGQLDQEEKDKLSKLAEELNWDFKTFKGNSKFKVCLDKEKTKCF